MIKEKLWEMCNLVFKDNHKLYQFGYVNGIDFVGYVHYKDHILLRKSTKERLIRKCRDIENKNYNVNLSDCSSIGSRSGLLNHCSGVNLGNTYIKPIQPYIDSYYELQGGML